MIKIYGLVDPRTNQIRYIGQTYRNLERRLYEHVYDCIRRPRSSHKVKWINSLIKANLIPTILLLETVDKIILEEREKYWILKLKSDGVKLTNSTEGGEFCTTGSNLSNDIKEHLSDVAKIRSIGKGNSMWGKHHKESSKEKMSIKKIGIYNGTNNPRARELFEYDIKNNFIRKWSHAKECADHYKISRGNISTASKHNTMLDNSDEPNKKYRLLKNMVFKYQ